MPVVLLGVWLGFCETEVEIIDCSSIGSVSGRSDVGGLVGFNDGLIENCHFIGTVISGVVTAGGLAGNNFFGTIQNCYSLGSVIGEDNVGGLIGYNINIVRNCYTRASAIGDYAVGGLISENDWVVDNCFSTGLTNGNINVGGLIGINSWVVDNCFWDTETSGMLISAGGTGSTTAQMQIQSTFINTGWDFVEEDTNGTENIWKICEGDEHSEVGLADAAIGGFWLSRWRGR